MILKKVRDNKICPVTLQEFKEVIDSFPPNKASDLSGISHDMFRHITDENLLIIVDWFNDLFKYDDYLSPELSKSRFSLLCKAGSASSLGNYRRLTVSSVMLRFLERILMRRGMDETLDKTIEDSQFGFRRFRSYQMCLLEICELIREYQAEKKPLFILSTDVAKCFPRMDPRVNLYEMIQQGLSGGELKFVRDTYLGRTSFLKVGNKVYTSINVSDRYGDTEGRLGSPTRVKVNFDTNFAFKMILN